MPTAVYMGEESSWSTWPPGRACREEVSFSTTMLMASGGPDLVRTVWLGWRLVTVSEMCALAYHIDVPPTEGSLLWWSTRHLACRRQAFERE